MSDIEQAPKLESGLLERVGGFFIKLLLVAVSIILNLAALTIIYKVIAPIANWYSTKIPIRGIDTFLSAVYVNYFLKWHDFVRPEGWKYIWFGGYPLSLDYPSLYFLAMIPFVSKFGLIPGVMHFAILALLILAVSSYFLYLELARNKSLALVLTIATVLSANLYRSLVWAGGIPFWTTQAFYPLVGFLIVKFLNSRNLKWLYLAATASGLGVMGHPQGFLNVILPFSLLTLIFYSGEKTIDLKKRLTAIFTFGGLFFLVGLPGILLNFLPAIFGGFLQVFSTFGTRFGKAQGIETIPVPTDTTGLAIIKFARDQFSYVFSDTQQFIWVFLITVAIGWLLTFIYRRNRIRGFLNILPFALFFGYEVGVIFLFSRNIDIFIGGWYKAFWPIPVAASALAAVLFGQTLSSFLRFERLKLFKYGKWPLLVILNIAILAIGYIAFPPVVVKNLIARIDELSSPSSPYPDVLNVKVSDKERGELAAKLLPDFIDGNDRNKRLYAVDATVNLGWPTLYEMPLARGYVDPPIGNLERWGLFWLDSVMGPSGKGPESSLILDWNVPEKVVAENIKFLLDWNAIYYLLGNYASDNPNILAKNVTTGDFIDANTQIKVQGSLKRYDTPDDPGGEKFYWDRYKIMNYYKIKEELVSPIISPSNASPILLIGDDSAYDTIYRFLGMKNLNSQKIIVATRSKFIDDYSLKELKKFDAVILYRYDYHRGAKAWKLIGDYLKEGGKVYIDTGPDVKEAVSSNLPDYFPFRKSVRDDIGRDWKVEVGDESLAKNVDFSKFSKLEFDDRVWNVSHPKDSSDLNSAAKVILTNNGKVIVAQMTVGSGTLIWTGFNLPYHVIREYNEDEAQFLTNLLASRVDLSEKRITDVNYEWISPEERKVDVAGARAVLFKEQAFDSWSAKTEKGNDLTIYKAGPTSPGFMYVPFSAESKPSKVSFNYQGNLKQWIYHLISVTTLIFLADQILTGGRFLGRPLKKILAFVTQPTSKWWHREDEE